MMTKGGGIGCFLLLVALIAAAFLLYRENLPDVDVDANRAAVVMEVLKNSPGAVRVSVESIDERDDGFKSAGFFTWHGERYDFKADFERGNCVKFVSAPRGE